MTTGRPADRVNDDDNERRCSSVSTARLLHQGDRRLDDRLSGVARSFTEVPLPPCSTGLSVLDDRLSRVRLRLAD